MSTSPAAEDAPNPNPNPNPSPNPYPYPNPNLYPNPNPNQAEGVYDQSIVIRSIDRWIDR